LQAESGSSLTKAGKSGVLLEKGRERKRRQEVEEIGRGMETQLEKKGKRNEKWKGWKNRLWILDQVLPSWPKKTEFRMLQRKSE